MLDNLVVAISGGVGRIGSTFTSSVCDNGGKVIIGDINAEKGIQLVSELGKDKAVFIEADLTNSKAIDRLIQEGKKKFGKIVTLVEGMDPKEIDLKDLGKKLKSKFACGGTVKKGTIELQGDHSDGVKSELVKLGFNADAIRMKSLVSKGKR